jgi:hypothetical protein
MALENYSVATALFPVTIAAACVLLMLLIAYRRRRVAADRSFKAGGAGPDPSG